MAFKVHNSGRRHNMPVATQSKQAILNIIMLSGYTSKLVKVTPMTVITLAPHPISLL